MARKRVGSSREERYDGRGDPKRLTRAPGKSNGSSGAGCELQQDQHGDDSSGSGEDESRMSRPPDSPPTPANRGGVGNDSDRESDGSDSEIEEHERDHEGGIGGERYHTMRNVPRSQPPSSRILHQNVSTPVGRSNTGRNQKEGQNIVTAPRVPARGALYNQQLALNVKDCHNWSLTMKESIRNEVFYLKQFARRNADYGLPKETLQ
jgi:hypothetical protein